MNEIIRSLLTVGYNTKSYMRSYIKYSHCYDLSTFVEQVTINQVEESEVNFVELVHSLLEDPSERQHFFQVRQLVHLNILNSCPNCVLAQWEVCFCKFIMK